MTAEQIRKASYDMTELMIRAEKRGDPEGARHTAITGSVQWLAEIAAQLAEYNEKNQ